MNEDKILEIKKKILDLVDNYSNINFIEKEFIPGVSDVPVSGKVIGALEIKNMVEASLDGWLTAGRFNTSFEQELALFLGIKSLII
jgi:CDP-6-deoxy-D-xylo-4-hexulose-3-dehydrase